MRDVLDNEINPGDFVIGMIVSRDSDGIRFGIANEKTITWGSFYNDEIFSLTTSTVRNIYKLVNLSEKEWDIKTKLEKKIEGKKQNEERLKAEKKALKRIQSKDLIIGKSYEGEKRSGNRFIYLGYGSVREVDSRGDDEDFKEGFIYLNRFIPDENGKVNWLPFYKVLQSRMKLTKQIDDLVPNFIFHKDFIISQNNNYPHKLSFKLEWRV